MIGSWLTWHSKGGCVHPPLNLKVLFSDILATASGIKTYMDLKIDMYNHIDTIKLFKKFWGISDIFDVFMTSLMSDLFVVLQFLATPSVINFIETTTLPSLMHNQLFCCWIITSWLSKKYHFQHQAYLKWRTFSSTCSTSPFIIKF